MGQARSGRLLLPVFQGPELHSHGEGRGLEMKAAESPGGKGDRLVDSEYFLPQKRFLTLSSQVPRRKGCFCMLPAGPPCMESVGTQAHL